MAERAGGGILRECNEIVEGRSFLETHHYAVIYTNFEISILFTGTSFAKGPFSRAGVK